MNFRAIILIVIMTLCILDLSMTYFYIYKYKKWQPNKPYKLIELNPILRISLETFGLHLGMFIASIIILALNYYVVKNTHWIFSVILFLILIFTMINHTRNITLLFRLIDKYPFGHLPVTIFGKVEENN